MSQGFALTIGLNHVSDWYGYAPELRGCIADATDTAKIAADAGFTVRSLFDAQATVDAILAEVRSAATLLRDGDTFFLHYSGHGMRGDLDGAVYDSGGHFNSAWCAYDTVLLNHRLYREWFAFEAGVRVVVISDSCHSGHATRAFLLGSPGRPPRRTRALPNALQRAVMKAHPESFPADDPTPGAEPGAAVVLLAGCQDEQESEDGDGHGLFTQGLLDAITGSADWQSLFATAKAATAKASWNDQVPVLFGVGDGDLLAAISSARPFAL